MTPRTLTVDTADLGTITINEPDWCAGDHMTAASRSPRTMRAVWRALKRRLSGRSPLDPRPVSTVIHHASEPVVITVDSLDGPIQLLALMLWQDPFPVPSSPHGTDVYVVGQFDADYGTFSLDGLQGLTSDLLDAAAAVRRIARDFETTLDGGGR